MRILIVNPPAFFDSQPGRGFVLSGSRWSHSRARPKGSRHYQPYPFSIGYAASLLKRDTDHKVKAIDASALDLDEKEFINGAKQFKPDLTVIDVPSLAFTMVTPLLESLKQDGSQIAISGLHATTYPEDVMNDNDFIDYLFIGEWEETLKAVANEENPNNIKGIAYRENGTVSVNRERNITNIDNLPFPDREDLPVSLYHDFVITGEPNVQMLATRGCPYRCEFCYITILYEKSSYRKRYPKDIVDEIEFVKHKYGAKQVYFDDDTIAVDKKFLKNIGSEMVSRGVDVPWSFMGDITIDSETLRYLTGTGLVGLKFGVETINGESLRIASKRFVNREKVSNFVKECKKLGLWTHATYQVGMPGETRESIRATIDFAMELDTSSLQISMSTPLPGTPFYQKAIDNGWLTTRDFTRYDGSRYPVVNYPELSSEEIKEMYDEFSKSWRKHLARRHMLHPVSSLRTIRKQEGKPTFVGALKEIRKAI